MKKASKILLIVGGVLHIISGIGFITAAIYFLAASIAFFGFGANWFGIPYEYAETEEAMMISMTICASLYIFFAFVFVGCGVFELVVSKYTFNVSEDENKKKYITSIVFSALFDNPPALVGSILGLIAFNKEQNEKGNEVVQD